MYDQDRTKVAKRIFITCGIIVILLLGFTVWHTLTFHVISTEPSTGKVSTVAPFFKVNFSQELSSDDVQITSSPSILIGKTTISGKVLTIPFKTTPLTSGKTYSITIASITSTRGDKIKNVTFTFKPTYIPSSELPKDQQQALLKLQGGGQPAPTNPITKDLPYETTNFMLSTVVGATADNKAEKFPLLAIITPSEADMGDESTAVAQYEQAVAAYITSLGFNPSSYNITYRIQNP
jgi:hypothetical protein